MAETEYTALGARIVHLEDDNRTGFRACAPVKVEEPVVEAEKVKLCPACLAKGIS